RASTGWCARHESSRARIQLWKRPLNWYRKGTGPKIDPSAGSRQSDRYQMKSPLSRQNVEWRDSESNRGHHDFQSCALPTELSRRKPCYSATFRRLGGGIFRPNDPPDDPPCPSGDLEAGSSDPPVAARS